MAWQGDLFLRTMTMCGNCDKLIPRDEAVVKTYFVASNIQQQEHFCCELCHQEWYLKKLRSSGQ